MGQSQDTDATPDEYFATLIGVSVVGSLREMHLNLTNISSELDCSTAEDMDWRPSLIYFDKFKEEW